MSRLRPVCCWLLLLSSIVAADRRPNVLFLMSDDLRPDLGCYGQPLVSSPNIDALAAAGVRFERAYVQYPLCNPSRASMLTGRYPTTTGVLDNQGWFGGPHPDWQSLPRFFKDHGYASLRAGKVFHGGIDDADAWTAGGEPRKFEGDRSPRRPAPNRAQSSDRIVTLEGNGESHNDYRAADLAIEYLQQQAAGDQPFFLCCGFTKPHSPPTAPERFLEHYAKVDPPLPPDFAPTAAAPPGFPKASITPSGDLFIGREAAPDAARDMIRAYWASVSWMDWNLGRVVAELDRLGLRDDTVIVFWGDHGYHLGEKGKWSKHSSLYEVGDRVPLIILAPGATGNGRSCPRVVESVDIYPTLVELCGLQAPPGLQGDSLAPLLKDPRAAWDKPAFTVSASGGKLKGIAVRTQQYRYATFSGEGGGEMLFDMTADPRELKNLADDPALSAVRSELAGLVEEFRTATAR
jgi:arylsulfatase A-like enzyme